MEFIDIRTLVFAGAVVTFCAGVALFLLSRTIYSSPGIGFLVAGIFNLFLGMILLVFRASLPPFVAILVNNFCVCLGYVIIWWGIRIFLGRRPLWWAGVVLSLLPMPILAAYMDVPSALFLRIIAVSSTNGIITAIIAFELLSGSSRPARRLFGGMFLAFSLYYFFVALGSGIQMQTGDFLNAGNVIRGLFIASLVFNVGFTTCVVLVLTDRINLQLESAKLEAEKANRAKSDFMANMSHEIRTPMNALAGLSALLLDSESREQRRRYVRGIILSSDSLLSIIDSILDYSKIEAGKMELENRPFRLDEVMDALLDITAHNVSEEVTVSIEPLPKVPKILSGDAGRLRQVLINLVNNGIKFTEKGSVRVDVVVRERTDESVLLEFAVKDTGIGIAPHHTAKLFSPFSQVDASATRKYGGTGLGLAISKRFVEMMGGEISVESEPGKGSTFRFTARFGVSHEICPVAKSGIVDAWEINFDKYASFRGLRVLLVEDNKFNRDIISMLFHKIGIVADVAGNGLEAVEKVRKNVYDIVFMDIQMPVMDGYEAAERILSMEGRETLPVVGFSASAGVDDVRRGREAGLADYLTKPINHMELFEVINRLVSGRSRGDEEAPAAAFKHDLGELQLPGVDVEGALRDFMGDEALYRMQLGAVRPVLRTFREECAEAVKAGDLVTARRKAHSLKGTAAILHLTELARGLIALEDVLEKRNRAEIDIEFREVEKRIRELDAALRTL